MRRLPVPNIYGNLFSVAQKVVAITGTGQGIGLALAEGFAAAGANVMLVDLNAETLAQARTKVEKISKHVTSVMTDVSADGAPAKIVAASKALGGRVDCLINNAGIMSYTDSRTITDDEFDRMIKINLKAPIRIMKAVLYEMESQARRSSWCGH
jgi:NAD(P)-dependent dehydrogenase (short-subunit alcohol dehydrogenase family)